MEVEVEVRVKMKEWGEVEKRGQGSVEPSSYSHNDIHTMLFTPSPGLRNLPTLNSKTKQIKFQG